MSSSTSEPDPRRATARVALGLAHLACLAGLLAAPVAALAGEATARGKKANITWIDARGSAHTAAAREIVYGYWNRVYLKVPRDGRNFKDEIHEEKGIPLANDFIRFSQIDTIDFVWRSEPDADRARLAMEITLINGTTRTGSGSALAGAGHPLSPWIAFTAQGASHRIELHPLSTESDRAGKPRLVSMVFTL